MRKQKLNADICMGGEKPVPVQVLDTHIVEIANGFKALMNSGLKKKTIVLLVHDTTRICKTDIEKVLDALPRLDDIYTEKRK